MEFDVVDWLSARILFWLFVYEKVSQVSLFCSLD
jgi:hypothetical protein